MRLNKILEDFPYLAEDDIRACFRECLKNILISALVP